MAEFDQFLPAITAFVGNKCPRLIMLNALKSVIRKFCDDSQIWVYDCPEIIIDKDNSEQGLYKLQIPFQSTICKLWVIDGREGLSKEYPKYIQKPTYYLNQNSELVIAHKDLNCLPQKINAVVSLSTTQDSLTCPDFIYQKYHDAIISAAIVRLQLMPSQEWADPSMVAIHQSLYEGYLAQAIKDRDDGFMLARRVHHVRPSYI